MPSHRFNDLDADGRSAPAAGSLRLIAMLVAMTAVAPVSLQIFLPALPAIQKSFATSTGITQLVLSLSVLANAFATLAYGPLSDRFGRRPVMLWATAVFILGSIWCVLAQTVGGLIIARMLQAAGAAAGMVLGRAIVRDVYDREQAASIIAYLTMAMVVAPMISPMLGALLIDHFSWRAIFVAMVLLGIALGALLLRQLGETRQRQRGGSGLWTGAGFLLRQPAFLAYSLQSSFAISMFFAFISGAPYFVIDVLEQSATTYGMWFAVISGAFMAGNFACARLTARIGLDRLIMIGSSISLCATLLASMILFSGHWTVLGLFGPMMAAAFANGLSMANAQAGAVSVDPALAGTASGLAGFNQMFVAALVSQAVGMFQNGTPYPMVAFMSGCALASFGFFAWLHRA